MKHVRLPIFTSEIARFCFSSFLAILLCSSSSASGESVFKDPLDYAATSSSNVAGRPMMAIAKAGERLVAVGSRGLIITSDNNGESWIQSKVPVQSDLLAVQFPTASDGWAVGHDGVILHSADGGKTWEKQLDGRTASDLYKSFYRNADASDPGIKRALDQLTLNFKAGPALPYLDVWFSDNKNGFVVGSFGMIAATADGGKTWEPWLHRIENGDFLNLNSVRGIDDKIYVVGERGTVYTLDATNRRFKKTSTGYGGSFFGITGNANVLLAFGLRGSVYRSGDAGKSWAPVKMGTDATIMGGTFTPDQNGVVLVNSTGQLLVGDAAAMEFRSIHPARSMRYTDVVFAPNQSMVLTGLGGVRIEAPLGNSK